MREEGLSRFTRAQRSDYEVALAEIRAGRKRSHWMWYIFPQLQGLGRSSTAQYYGIRDLQEARDFLADPYLGGNLRQISAVLLELSTDDAEAVFGWPDVLKLRSCMTLFSRAEGHPGVFDQVLEKFYGGEADGRTLELLGID